MGELSASDKKIMGTIRKELIEMIKKHGFPVVFNGLLSSKYIVMALSETDVVICRPNEDFQSVFTQVIPGNGGGIHLLPIGDLVGLATQGEWGRECDERYAQFFDKLSKFRAVELNNEAQGPGR